MTSMIQDYAIIGDGRSCALVARTGSIDFLCWPRFDSDACLAALLGDERHGYWRIAPAGYVAQTTRSYRDNTTILETEHVTDTGRVRVTDLMPWHDGPSSIIRIVEGLEGEAPMAMSLRLRFGYGRITPWTQRHERGLVFEAGPDRVVLDCPVDLTMDAEDASARFLARQGREDRLRPYPFAFDGSAARAFEGRRPGRGNPDGMEGLGWPVRGEMPLGRRGAALADHCSVC